MKNDPTVSKRAICARPGANLPGQIRCFAEQGGLWNVCNVDVQLRRWGTTFRPRNLNGEGFRTKVVGIS